MFVYSVCLFVTLSVCFVHLVAFSFCVYRNHGAISGKRNFQHPAFPSNLYDRFDDFVRFQCFNGSSLSDFVYLHLHDLNI
jgi:hypothetical protein